MDHFASREKAGSLIVHNSKKTYPGSITLDMEVSNMCYARNANDKAYHWGSLFRNKTSLNLASALTMGRGVDDYTEDCEIQRMRHKMSQLVSLPNTYLLLHKRWAYYCLLTSVMSTSEKSQTQAQQLKCSWPDSDYWHCGPDSDYWHCRKSCGASKKLRLKWRRSWSMLTLYRVFLTVLWAIESFWKDFMSLI